MIEPCKPRLSKNYRMVQFSIVVSTFIYLINQIELLILAEIRLCNKQSQIL